MKTARRSLKTKILVFALLVAMVFPTFSLSAAVKVDINTATVEELQQITGVGPVIAQKIIDGRPYAGVDDLINVNGIGTSTLQKIKDQGIAYVPAKDTSGKVNINNAALEELQQITGVGPVIAQHIIDGRPYESVDDLSKVSGIGAATLQKIKDQGLAYVVIEDEGVIEKIDINTASLEDLQKITGIGPALAQRIIDGRLYASLDDLLNVSGIGTATLQKIKDQGVAYASEAITEKTFYDWFPDPVFAKVVADELDMLPTDVVSTETLREVTMISYHGWEKTKINSIEGIGLLTNLKYLSLGNNQLTSLPESFWNLTNLRTLFIYNYSFTSHQEIINKARASFPNLKTIY